MSRFIKLFIFAIVFSFAWGAWWGLYNIEKNSPNYKKGPEVRILMLKGFLDPKFLEVIEKKYKVNFVLTEKESDADLLREALSENKNYDLIQIRSFIAKSFLFDSVFIPLDPSLLERKSISIDFQSLNFDPGNKYLVPITWGINGFIVNAQKVDIGQGSLEELLFHKEKFSVLPSYVELLNLFSKLKPIVKNWIETGQTEELAKDLSSLKERFYSFSSDPRENLRAEKVAVAQISNGLAASFISQNSDYNYVLANEGSTLWINFLGISQGIKNTQRVYDVINLLLREDINKELVQANEQATTLASLNSSDLHYMQKASYIRALPLSRVDLFVNSEAVEPIWVQAIKNTWRDILFQ